MMKKENDSCAFAPRPSPPGFPRQPPKTCTTKSKSVCNENGTLSYMHEQNQTPDVFSEEQPPRRTSRKRSRPEFFAITTPRSPPPGQRRRGRPPRSGYQSPLVHLETERRSCPQFYAPTTARPMRGQRRRGRPPKAGYQSPPAHLETETRNSNQDSSAPSRMTGENILTFLSSLEIAMDQSSVRVNDEVAEHVSHIINCPSPHQLTPIKTGHISVDKIRPRVGQSSSFNAEDIEETLTDVSLAKVTAPVSYEKTQNLSRNYRISEGIDPKFLQHVANALQHMAGTQTALDDAKVISRSSDTNNNLVHTLKAIIKRHGDITQDSLLESDFVRTSVLHSICEMVQDLQKKQLKDLDISTLGSYYTAVSDLEYMKVDVQWLHSRLDEIKDALNLSDEAKGIINEREGRVGNINRKKKELERLKSEAQDVEVQLAREVVMVDELNKKFDNQMSKIARFEHANLMDGLI